MAIPTGKRHKTRTAHLGEPREEELQEKYTDVAVSSGTHLFPHSVEIVQARSPQYLGKVAMVPLRVPHNSFPLTAGYID